MAALSARPPGNPCRRPATDVHPMELPPPLVSGCLPVPCHIYAWTSTRGEFIISGHHINTPRDVWSEHCDNAVKENNACLYVCVFNEICCKSLFFSLCVN
ncbi:hypothetical protein VPH35_020881 [Triticum aestivum]